MISDAQKRATAKYHAEKIVLVTLKLNKGTDSDILEFLEKQKNKRGYIKNAIREKMAREAASERQEESPDMG